MKLFINRAQSFTLINSLHFFQMCKIAKKIEIEIDFTKREKLWDPRTRRCEIARVGARNATIRGSIGDLIIIFLVKSTHP